MLDGGGFWRSVGKLGACAETSGEGEQQQRHISQFQKSLSVDAASGAVVRKGCNPEGGCPEGRRPHPQEGLSVVRRKGGDARPNPPARGQTT